MTKHERAIEAAEEAGQAAWRGASSAEAWAAGIAAYLAVMREPAEGEVRVRVCVGVLECGYWNAVGQKGNEDWASKVDVDDEEGGTQFRWVEATVPGWQPPDDPVVEGEVVG